MRSGWRVLLPGVWHIALRVIKCMIGRRPAYRASCGLMPGTLDMAIIGRTTYKARVRTLPMLQHAPLI